MIDNNYLIKLFKDVIDEEFENSKKISINELYERFNTFFNDEIKNYKYVIIDLMDSYFNFKNQMWSIKNEKKFNRLCIGDDIIYLYAKDNKNNDVFSKKNLTQYVNNYNENLTEESTEYTQSSENNENYYSFDTNDKGELWIPKSICKKIGWNDDDIIFIKYPTTRFNPIKLSKNEKFEKNNDNEFNNKIKIKKGGIKISLEKRFEKYYCQEAKNISINVILDISKNEISIFKRF